MLLGEQLRRSHERRLRTAARGAGRRRRRDHRLAAAGIALQEAQHRHAAREIGARLGEHPRLGTRERERQRREEAPLELRRIGELPGGIGL